MIRKERKVCVWREPSRGKYERLALLWNSPDTGISFFSVTHVLVSGTRARKLVCLGKVIYNIRGKITATRHCTLECTYDSKRFKRTTGDEHK